LLRHRRTSGHEHGRQFAAALIDFGVEDPQRCPLSEEVLFALFLRNGTILW
jgi:hypothetical protein